MTAKFISDRTGEATIGVESTAKEMQAVRLSNYVPSQREVTSIGKRKLLTPDEVLRLPRDDALVIFRGQKVLKVKKFDYTMHPESKKLRDSNARDYIPNWRDEWEPPVFSADDYEDERRQPIPTVKATKRKPAEVPRKPPDPPQVSDQTTATTSQPKLTPIPPPQDASIPCAAQTNEAVEATPPVTNPLAPAKRPRGRPRKKAGDDKWSHLQLALNDDEPFEPIEVKDVLSDL